MGATAGLLAVTPAQELLAATGKHNGTDSLATQLYKSLSDSQREKVCLPANHPKRQYISNWWYIHPEHRIPTSFTPDQQDLIRADAKMPIRNLPPLCGRQVQCNGSRINDHEIIARALHFGER